VVYDSRTPTSLSLEPGKVLARVPEEVIGCGRAIFVSLNDDSKLVELELSVFLSRQYPIVGDKVRIGSKNLKLDNLVVTVGFKLQIEDLSGMTDFTVD
jgi:hypothetical protein